VFNLFLQDKEQDSITPRSEIFTCATLVSQSKLRAKGYVSVIVVP